MYTFFKTDSKFEMIKLLLHKLRKENFSISVIFPDPKEISEFSVYLWNSGDCVAHGVEEDDFLEKQNVILSLTMRKKDAVIVVDEAKFDEGDWKKIIFVGDFYKNKFEGQYFSYFNKQWKSLTKDLF